MKINARTKTLQIDLNWISPIRRSSMLARNFRRLMKQYHGPKTYTGAKYSGRFVIGAQLTSDGVIAKMGLQTINLPNDKTVNLNKVYDAVIVGSGAAGGMAAHVLTSHGMKVLLLEAGRRIDTTEELKSTEWPYEHPRRGNMPPSDHALSFNEYTIRQPPYANGIKAKHVFSYVPGWGGSDYSKNIVVDEKDHPYTGTNYAWVRARCL